MPSHAEMTRAVEEYVAAFGAGNAARIAALFAENAVVEDPVGSEPKRGMAAIAAFYEMSVATGAKLELEGPVRTAADSALFAFSVHLEMQGKPMRIDVIDRFGFDADGKVSSMQAWFGPENMHMLNGSQDHA